VKNALKQTNLLFLALSLTIILADCNFMGNAFSHLVEGTQRECADLSGNSDHNGSVSFEDEIFMNDVNIKSTTFFGCIALVSIQNDNFKSHFITSIWQPPKF